MTAAGLIPRILDANAAAAYCGFATDDKAVRSFKAWARKRGILTVPGRKGHYDRMQIDAALNLTMGLTTDQRELADAWLDMHDAAGAADKWLDQLEGKG